jgi:hypothetical protein
VTTIFLVCALVGGTVLAVQFVLTFIGLGADVLDVDVPGDVTDADVDFGGNADFDAADTASAADHLDSSWMFQVISFRTVVAALTFFGLGGLTARSMDYGSPMQLVVAVATGLAAMYGVFWLMQSLMRLRSEGTPRIGGTIGRHGTVYTTIPAHESGAGKIQINLQNRTMEYLALTHGEALAPGATVVVTGVVTPDTVAVEPVLEPEGSQHV